MVPSVDVLARAYVRVAAEFGLPERHNLTALRLALQQADHLADDIYDAPAALLFAFGRYPRCFAAFRTMSVMAVAWHARSLGFKLEASPSELAETLVRVAAGELTYDDVRAWTADRLIPFGG